MSDHRRLLLISVLVLAALFFVEYFFLHDYLPDYIPNTPIRVGGLYLMACFTAVYYVVFKKMIKENSDLSVFYLIVFGVLIALFSEVIFQFYRQFNLYDASSAEKARYFFAGILGTSITAGIIAISIAIDVKFKNRWLNTLVIIGLLIIFYFAKPYVFDLLDTIKG